MNLKGYILTFGKKDFEEFAFNEIDASLFAFLSYANWEIFAPGINELDKEYFSFKSINDEKVDQLVKDTPTPNSHKKLLLAIISTKRYKNVKVKYVDYRFDFERKQQYFAVTFDIPGIGNYISFRGTDLSILGWEEDFRLALNIVTNAQADSLNYLIKVSSLIDGNFYVGGHSKGGNMALYASMNADEKIQERIINVYSLDGPGFFDDSFYESSGYKNIENKIIQIVPKDSFVGVIFNTPKKYKIVSSRNPSVFSHIAYSWRIKRNGTFRYRKKRTYMSYVRQRALVKWLENADYETKLLTIDSMVTGLGGSDKTLLLYLKHPVFIGKSIIFWNKKYTVKQKKILFKFTAKLVKSYISSFLFFLNKQNRDNVL